MRKIFSLLKPYRVAIVIAFSLMLIELAVELFQPFVMARMIDNGIIQQDLKEVLKWGGVLLSFTLIAFTAGIINSFYAAHVSQGFGYEIRDLLFTKIQSFSFSVFQSFQTSSLITRLTNDVGQIQVVAFMILRIMMRAPLLVVGSVVMAFIVNAKLAFFFAVCVPLLLLFLIQVMKRASRLFRNVQERLDNVNSVMQENLAGIRLVKAFVRRHYEMKRFTTASEELKGTTVSALRMTEMAMPVILLVMNASVMVFLWFGNIQVQSGTATVGEVVAIVNYAIRITMALSMVSMIIMTLSRAKASLVRIADVVDREEQSAGKERANKQTSSEHWQQNEHHRLPDRWRGELVFDRVSFRYPNRDHPVLDRISFKVRAGETIAIIGETGSGKSTLFQLIPRLYEADEGVIYIDGIDIRSMDFDYLRKRIGYVTQEVVLFTGTIRENIMWGNEDATEEEMIAAAKRAQIHSAIMSFPQQYDTVLGQRGVNLSGGQKQRLSIARALIRQPDLLLLDDSTSALDVKTEARMLKALKEIPCTTLMITQKLSTAMSVDRILLMEDGKIVAYGSHEELYARSPLYQRIYRSQYGKGAG